MYTCFPIFIILCCICYRSKLFLGYSIFKLAYFFQTRSICLNLGQLVNLDQFGAGKKHRTQATSQRSLFYQIIQKQS